MFLQKKALYNLIQLNLTRIEKGEIKIEHLEPWQTEDYRTLSMGTLLEGLHELGCDWSVQEFELLVKNFETPEEFAQSLAEGKEPLDQDRLYLLLFELWRRLCPQNRSMSIFCDELDHQIMAYDMEEPNEVSDQVAYLQQILDEHVDKGLSPHEAFKLIQLSCANDIESFLFDYILEQVELAHVSYASDLIEGFKRYIHDVLSFDYLEARMEIVDEPEEGFAQLENLITRLTPEEDPELIEEMLFFLASKGNHTLFCSLAKKNLESLEDESDFKRFLQACYLLFDTLELPKPSLLIASIYHSRHEIEEQMPLNKEDPALTQVRALLCSRLHCADDSSFSTKQATPA